MACAPRIPALILAGLVACAALVPVKAQDVSEEADFLLWCGSAFYFLGLIVDDEAESDSFLAAGAALSDRGAEWLFSQGMNEDEVIATVEAYDARVVADFEAEADLPFDAEACIAALGS